MSFVITGISNKVFNDIYHIIENGGEFIWFRRSRIAIKREENLEDAIKIFQGIGYRLITEEDFFEYFNTRMMYRKELLNKYKCNEYCMYYMPEYCSSQWRDIHYTFIDDLLSIGVKMIVVSDFQEGLPIYKFNKLEVLCK